jgi:uncharacterized protein DUF2017
MSPVFDRTKEGAVRVTLSKPERDLLRSLPDELRGLYTVERDDDPVRSRLFPRAYLDPTAEDAEREWRELVQPQLVNERLLALDRLVASLEQGEERRGGTVVAELDDDDAAAWLGVLNDARLALGTRLEVTEELDIEALDPRDPNAPAFAAYAWLTYLQGELVETLLAAMPDDEGAE